ncbi:RNA-directed DNA polymerase, eukaryota, reverse transcriptase zinc-binding domain protein [Tanacetum coccineum]
MLKVPMKAWNVKGMSALASCLGKPIIIDEVTTRMCVTSVGRIGFARVLIEIDAGKEIKDRIKVMYKGKNVAVGTKKFMDVEYAWKPSACAHCKVFGHEETKCRIKNKSEQSTNVEQASGNEFKIVHNKKKEDNNIQNKTNTKESKNGNNNLKEDELRGISKSNRFTLLNELVDEEELVPIVNEREVVDKFVKNRINPTEKDMENWNSPIIRYFKDRKEIIDVIDNMEEMDFEDVVDEVNGNEKSCLRNEVDGGGGLSTSDKQKEIQKLINEEKIQLMAVLETHIKVQSCQVGILPLAIKG